jgi:branched-chain amino acid transport system substrate-binding protein
MFGTWWSGAEPDLKDIGAAARGYSAVMMQHGSTRDSDVVKEILAQVHAKGQGTGPREEVGDVLYMRGVVGAMLAVEGVFRAQERFGKGKVMTGEQARWGYENLDIGRGRLGQLGFTGVISPVKTACDDHMGSAFARIHTWDGSRFNWSSDWLQADESIIRPMVKASADRYAAEKKLTRRSPADCNN